VCYVHGGFIQNLFNLTNSQLGSYKNKVIKMMIAVLSREYCIQVCGAVVVVVGGGGGDKGHLSLARFSSDCTSEFGCYYSVGIELSANVNARMIRRPLIVCTSISKNDRNPFIMALSNVQAA
jgi:hypothetical protein